MCRQILYVLAAAALCACSPDSKEPGEFDGMLNVEYQEMDKAFANPERGFYSPVDYHSPSASPMSASTVAAGRQQGRSLFYIGYYLTDFMESDISEEYLNLMRANFEVLRKNGAKCILRYAYKDGYSESDHPWDASVEWTLRHVEQLKPVWQENADVILCLQSGFVGAWGEWYYTDNFVYQPSSQEDYKARIQLVEAQLDALPARRQICMRGSYYKRNILGISYADTLTASTAFTETPQARLAGHNDCFLASSDDWGTFLSPKDREFWESETRYLIMGGETCNPCKYSECANSLNDMEAQHWTYLNFNYHPGVLGGWRKNGCFSEIEQRLGYRLVLREGHFDREAVAGTPYRVVLEIKNEGFAAPVNPRDAELVLKGSDGKEYVTELDCDPRRWFAGNTVRIDTSIDLPDAAGEYRLYLNLPDPEPALRDNPLFSIRLANVDCWDEETGYNYVTEISF